ncbi:hypothetical protein [Croceitalea rosinachiae]|uniref:Class I SAM-dependent methyltransferase n=1 Tax=Croceitalea rosinachiae TaxID=3075596 RepID=A0ABU3ACK4_9FLAO|nr:hypothetical protein [Croceitalea sp. F388]MDT0606838.1 hypothetical protein [Croceitalea sp. F388]
MKRIELFEFEDFDWLPSAVRTGATNLIIIFHQLMGTKEVIAQLLLDLQKQHHFNRIVDLGSGSGGPMPDVVQQLNKSTPEKPVSLLLSDLHPNPKIVAATNGQNNEHIKYHTKPINASEIGNAPEGLKTMIASFHHMNPSTAKKILRSAEENREPLFIYEVAKNNVPLLLWVLLLPLSLTILLIMSLVMTLFVRPLTFKQLLFTYIIPLIPIVYAWDGQASLMRTYTFNDIEHLLAENKNPNYQWTIADATKPNGKKLGYYISGMPTKSE